MKGMLRIRPRDWESGARSYVARHCKAEPRCEWSHDEQRGTHADRQRSGGGGAGCGPVSGRPVAGAAQGGGARSRRGLRPARGSGGPVRPHGPPRDGAARPRRVRQDGPACPPLPGSAQAGPSGRVALARRGGRGGVGGEAPRPGFRAGRRRDLRSGRRAQRPPGPGTGSSGSGQPGRVPDRPADPGAGAARRAVRARARRSGTAAKPRGGRADQQAGATRPAAPARGDGVSGTAARARGRHVPARGAGGDGDRGGPALLEVRHLAVLRREPLAAQARRSGPRLGGLAHCASHPPRRRPARRAGRHGRPRRDRRVDRDAVVARPFRRRPRLRAGHRAFRPAGDEPDRRGDPCAKHGAADRVDGRIGGAVVDCGPRVDDAAASPDQAPLRAAAVRGGAGAVPGHPPRDRQGARAPRPVHRGAAPRGGGGRRRAARPDRRGHRRRPAVVRAGARSPARARRDADPGSRVRPPAPGAGALRGARGVGRHGRGEAAIRGDGRGNGRLQAGPGGW